MTGIHYSIIMGIGIHCHFTITNASDVTGLLNTLLHINHIKVCAHMNELTWL